jgi:hypothetical protein
MSTWNWWDLQTLGSQPLMPKNLPDHCNRVCTLKSCPREAQTQFNICVHVRARVYHVNFPYLNASISYFA